MLSIFPQIVILRSLIVDLNEWIDSKGGVAGAAEILGESPRAVASWYYAERAPKLKSVVNIIEKSGYQIDFNGVFEPMARAMFGFKRPE